MTAGEIEQSLQDAIAKIYADVDERLGQLGFRVGALVDYRLDSRGDTRRYKISRISWQANPRRPRLGFYGFRMWSDGSFSRFEHTLTQIRAIIPVESEDGHT
jgi:hypothetical protein